MRIHFPLLFAIPNLQQLFFFLMALSAQRATASFLSNESAPRWKYDVFLSFRGVDTRKGFVSHLYHELCKCQGISTFFDDRELEGGTSISLELLTAIKESHIAIVVLSPNYASSKWCLNELTTILQFMEARNSVLPVFYETDPSDVGNQRGCFAKAFLEHEEKLISIEDKKKVVQWKADLKRVSKICGWHSKESKDESELIEKIVNSVWRKGTGAIEAISLRLLKVEEVRQWNCEAFSKMDGLRFLEFDNLIFSSGPKFLPCSLRIINWSFYHSKSLPTSFQLRLLTQLKMRKSKLVRLWEGKKVTRDIWGFFRLLGLRKSRPDPPCWGLVLSSLNRLCSLKELYLSNCKLSEGDIPDDIGCLSFLVELILSGNNFVSLPESIRCLSKLKYLDLEGCKSLQELPPLPSSSELCVNVKDCTSLKRLSDPSKLSSRFTNLYDFDFTCKNCTALVQDEGWNNTILSRVRRIATQTKGLNLYSQKLDPDVVWPGSEIPEWFSNQSVGHSINVELPPPSCTNWLGIAFCVVFQDPTQNLANPAAPCHYDYFNIQFLGDCLLRWDCKIGSLVSEHIWVFYFSRECCHHEQFLFETCLYDIEGGKQKADFNSVKKCGARLVYKQDLKELNQTLKILKRTHECRDEVASSGPESARCNITEQIRKRHCYY
ncbi:hypothetical protein DVH24_009411 [Malus domestica]|uniref:TIR domain-containing protein n=1 Tax=Malus domestica TaxID=3750 RepID=A0A498IQQ8_MALDO|nr:hypothetical protein DVH24_009411 [Malus domestica]